MYMQTAFPLSGDAVFFDLFLKIPFENREISNLTDILRGKGQDHFVQKKHSHKKRHTIKNMEIPQRLVMLRMFGNFRECDIIIVSIL